MVNGLMFHGLTDPMMVSGKSFGPNGSLIIGFPPFPLQLFHGSSFACPLLLSPGPFRFGQGIDVDVVP